jgi:hypothetical protein
VINGNFFLGIDFDFVDEDCTDDMIVSFESSSVLEKRNGSVLFSKSIGNGSPGKILNAPEIHIIDKICVKDIYLE